MAHVKMIFPNAERAEGFAEGLATANDDALHGIECRGCVVEYEDDDLDLPLEHDATEGN